MGTVGTLCYVRNGERLLLQLKADGRFGGGLWNAPGGKLLGGESPTEATVREVREETGLTVRDLVAHGTLTFFFGDAAAPSYTVHLFSTTRFDGELRPSEEGRLEWFAEDALPYERMWPDDRHWVPLLLAGKRFEGAFRLSEDLRRVLWYELRVEERPAGLPYSS